MGRNVRGVTAFLAICFGVAWFFWEVPLRLGVSVSSPVFQVFVVPGAFAPALAAFVVRKWVTREGFADAGLSLNLHRWPYYLAAWLIPLSVVAFDCVAVPLLGLGDPDYSLQNSALFPAMAGLAQSILPATIAMLSLYAVFTTPVIWGEEFGWRSYLQMRMFQSRPLLASVVTGLIWGFWHFPLLLRGSELPLHPTAVLAIFPAATVLYSIIFGWLRTRSESIWASSLAHSAINHLRSPLVAMLFASQRDLLAVAVLGLVPLAFVAAAIVLSGGLKPLQQSHAPAP